MVLGQAESDLSVYNTAGPYSNGDSSYITAAWDEHSVYRGLVPTLIVVGDEVFYTATVEGMRVTYRNIALRSDTRYEFFTRYDIENELNPAEVSTNQTRCILFYLNLFQFLFSYIDICIKYSQPHRVYSAVMSVRTLAPKKCKNVQSIVPDH